MQPTVSSAPAPRPNPAGLASLIAGAVLLLLGFVRILISQSLPLFLDRLDLSFPQVSIWLQAANVLSALIALVTVVLGVVGLLLPGRRRTAAIIGTTLGAAQLANTAVSLLGGLLIGLVSG